MDILSELTPRVAGGRVVEPLVSFDHVERAIQAPDRCAMSCSCIGTDCRLTDNSLAFAE